MCGILSRNVQSASLFLLCVSGGIEQTLEQRGLLGASAVCGHIDKQPHALCRAQAGMGEHWPASSLTVELIPRSGESILLQMSDIETSHGRTYLPLSGHATLLFSDAANGSLG